MRRVTTTDQKVGLIFLDEHSKKTISTQMAAHMTQTKVRKKSCQAVRRAAKGPMPKQPKTLAEIVLPDWCLKLADTEESFLKYDSGAASGVDRIQIYGREEDIQRLCNSPRVYGDGSFKRPLKKLWAQYWTLHGEVSQTPLVIKVWTS